MQTFLSFPPGGLVSSKFFLPNALLKLRFFVSPTHTRASFLELEMFDMCVLQPRIQDLAVQSTEIIIRVNDPISQGAPQLLQFVVL